MLRIIHKVFFLLVLFTLCLFINGCADNNVAPSTDTKNSKIADNSSVEAPKNGDAKQEPTGKKNNETVKITVYHASQDALYLVPEVHAVPAQAANAQTALELLLAGTTNKDLVAVMPQGVKLRGITIKSHVAYADFNDALAKNSGGGSQTELLIVGAIVNTLTEFPEIHKVQILIEGKKADTISGHLDVSEPFTRFERLIKKST